MQVGQKDLERQHRNWIGALITQNLTFWKQVMEIGEHYPERLVRWNRTLLVLEVVGLSRIASTSMPDNITDAPEVKVVTPLVDSIMAGDVERLSDRELTGLACSVAGVPEDWLSWVPAAMAWTGQKSPTGTRDSVGEAVRAGTQPPADQGEYGSQLQEADRLRLAGDLRAAAKIYGRLLYQGGNADQRVLVGRAVALDQEKPSETIRLAKLAIALDPSTPLADTASALITKHTGEQLHRDVQVRPDVIAYLREAVDFYHRNEAAGKTSPGDLERATGHRYPHVCRHNGRRQGFNVGFVYRRRCHRDREPERSMDCRQADRARRFGLPVGGAARRRSQHRHGGLGIQREWIVLAAARRRCDCCAIQRDCDFGLSRSDHHQAQRLCGR